MKAKIRLDTATDIANFVIITNRISEPVYVTDGNRLCIDGKSFLGLTHATEFKTLWCECDKDIYNLISPFIVQEG